MYVSYVLDTNFSRGTVANLTNFYSKFYWKLKPTRSLEKHGPDEISSI